MNAELSQGLVLWNREDQESTGHPQEANFILWLKMENTEVLMREDRGRPGGRVDQPWRGPGGALKYKGFAITKESDLSFLGIPPDLPTANSVVPDVLKCYSNQLSKPGLKCGNSDHPPTSLPQQSLT